MTIFVILAPYAAFALLMLVTSTASSLFAAAAICLATIALDLARGRSIKLLGVSSAAIFAGLGCYQVLGSTPLSILAVKVAVDAGLLLFGLSSLALRRPFTLQYAREMTEPEIARLPSFVASNYVITSVWVLAFLLMVAANLLLLNWPSLPLWSGLVMAFAIRNPAIYFSRWYPDYLRRKFGTIPQAN
jgi:hypothetical protein